MADYKSMPTLIEDKLTEKLQAATIDDVSTYVVVGIGPLLLDWNTPEEYPRIVIYCDEDAQEEEQIGTGGFENKIYTANIMLLCFNEDYDESIIQRDIILKRIKESLRADKRLSSLVDNTSNEKVWNSRISRTRYSKSGFNGSYQVLSWIELVIQTSQI